MEIDLILISVYSFILALLQANSHRLQAEGYRKSSVYLHPIIYPKYFIDVFIRHTLKRQKYSNSRDSFQSIPYPTLPCIPPTPAYGAWWLNCLMHFGVLTSMQYQCCSRERL